MMNKNIISKTFFKLLPIQIIMVAIGSINSIIDGMVATNLIGPLALTACGLFFPIIKLMDTVNMTLLGGAQILCSNYIGKNQVDRSKSVFSLDMIAVVVFGGLLSIICLTLCQPISNLIVNDTTVASDLADYMKGYAPGIIAYLLVSQLTAFLQIEGQEKRTYIGMAMMIVTNIVADVVFVAVFKLGLFGLGLATSLSNFVYVAILISFYFTGMAGVHFQMSVVEIRDFIDTIRIGFPGATAQLAQAVRGIVLNMLMLHFVGQIGVAAFAAVNAFGCLYFATTAGIANATRVLCSVYSGEEDRNALHEVMSIAIKKGGLMVTGIAIVLMMCAMPFTRMFYLPEAGAVYNMTRMGFLLFPLSMPFSCIFCIYSNYYQCRKHLIIANILSIVDGLAGVILFSSILTPILAMNGIWLAQVLNGLLCVTIIYIYVCILQKKIPTSILDTMLLPDNFGVAEENRIDVCVRSMEETLELSQQVMDFCHKHGVDNKRAIYAGLSIEEMAGNIVRHGFSDGKDHTIDVRVIYKENSLLIRIKDDCKMFNPKAMQQMMEPEDVTKNIGIRMISKMAHSLDYINSFGLNVLTLEI